MLNEKQFIESQKDCASMLGMSLDEYENYCQDINISKLNTSKIKKKNNPKYDNSILKKLGLNTNDLKVGRN